MEAGLLGRSDGTMMREKHMNRLVSIASTLVIAAGLWASVALAQSFPVKPIRMITPYPAGGIDSTGRLMTPRMSESLGQPVIIENRPGANGNIGTELVARSAPDGYTILLAASSTLVIGPALYKSVPFDPLKDFAPILLPIAGLATFAVSSSVPVNSLRELIDYAKRNPGKLSYGSSGIGGIFHLTGEQFKQSAGVDLFHVPYKGSGPAWLDVVAGRIDIGFPTLDFVRPQMAVGKLKVIAIAEAKRHPQIPDVPTVAEVVPGFEKPPSWFGFFAPARVPAPMLTRLVDAAQFSLKSADVRSRQEESGFMILGYGPDEIPAIMKHDLVRSAKLIKSIGIQPE
jgi:tripartite-type tricarboxylate transporter receptor subunit TctC